MKLYISEGALWLLTVFYLPLVGLLLWQLWRHLPKRPLIRIAGVTGAAMVAATIPLWDVLMTSTKMATLCPDAGVTIKRTIRADGFYTNFGDVGHLERGFTYIEKKSPGHVKIFAKVGNEVRVEEIRAEPGEYVPKSRYEFIYGAEMGPYMGRSDIGIQRSIVRDRETGEELG